jgi:hypothetical protein
MLIVMVEDRFSTIAILLSPFVFHCTLPLRCKKTVNKQINNNLRICYEITKDVIFSLSFSSGNMCSEIRLNA